MGRHRRRFTRSSTSSHRAGSSAVRLCELNSPRRPGFAHNRYRVFVIIVRNATAVVITSACTRTRAESGRTVHEYDTNSANARVAFTLRGVRRGPRGADDEGGRRFRYVYRVLCFASRPWRTALIGYLPVPCFRIFRRCEFAIRVSYSFRSFCGGPIFLKR